MYMLVRYHTSSIFSEFFTIKNEHIEEKEAEQEIEQKADTPQTHETETQN